MKKESSFLERLAQGADVAEEPLPGQPIVELAGDHRVLVENHRGVVQYSTEKIGIKMKYGLMLACGCGLQLAYMSKEKLIICGKVNSIQLIRR